MDLAQSPNVRVLTPRQVAAALERLERSAALALDDSLARELSVPFVVTPKIGIDFGYWRTGTAGSEDAEGWSVGLRWAVQFALELDFLEPRAARRVDQEWGINHTVLFCELFGSTMGGALGSGLPVGSDLAWVAGLGLTF